MESIVKIRIILSPNTELIRVNSVVYFLTVFSLHMCICVISSIKCIPFILYLFLKKRKQESKALSEFPESLNIRPELAGVSKPWWVHSPPLWSCPR